MYFDFIVRVFDWYSFFTLGLVPKQARPLAPEDERQRPPGSPLHGLLPDDVAHVKLWVHGPHDAPAYVPRTGGSWSFCPPWSTHFTIDYVTESETELTSDPTPPNTRALSPVHASVPLWNVFTVLLQLIMNFKRVLYILILWTRFLSRHFVNKIVKSPVLRHWILIMCKYVDMYKLLRYSKRAFALYILLYHYFFYILYIISDIVAWMKNCIFYTEL